MLNGVNITDLVRSKLRFECSPVQLFISNRAQKIANFSLFEAEISEAEAFQIYNRGCLTQSEVTNSATKEVLALIFEEEDANKDDVIQVTLPFHKEAMRF